MRKISTLISGTSRSVWLVSLSWLLGAVLIVGFGMFNGQVILALGLVLMLIVPIASLHKINRATREIKVLLGKQKATLARLHIDRSGSLGDRSTRSQRDTESSSVQNPARSKVAVFGNSPLIIQISSDFRPVTLARGIAKAIFTVEQPKALIIQETVVDSYQWRNDAKESDWFDLHEVLEVYNTAVDLGVPIFVIPTRNSPLTVRSLRNGSIVVPAGSALELSKGRLSPMRKAEMEALYQILEEFSNRATS